MHSTKKQIEVIEMAAKNAELNGQLYKAYAEKFPDYRDFWLKLSDEKKEHAEWMCKLQGKIKEGSVHFNEKRFNVEAIRSLQNYLKGQLAKVQNQDVRLVNVLSISLDIEKASMDRKCFEIFEGDSVTLQYVLRDLAEANRDHFERVQEVWAKERK